MSKCSIFHNIFNTVKAPNVAHLRFLTSIGYNKKEAILKKITAK